jgi:hypothetical protein
MKKIKTVAIEDIVPYMDETPISEETFKKFEFYHLEQCQTYRFYITKELFLQSFDNYSSARLGFINYYGDEYFKTWTTEGELKMLLMLFAESTKNED